ncbi:MAG: hypothetical protein J6584_09200 [Lactobacillus sp.]|nr:hypothetical protein [Lactobacillus sp.]
MKIIVDERRTRFDAHEYQLKKQENLPKTCSYVVTYISDDTITAVSPSGELTRIAPGTILGLNYEVKTNKGYMEVRSINGTVFRLGPNSTFSVQQTIVGEVPVYYGAVYISTSRFSRIYDGGKYRTSCYNVIGYDSLIENIDNSSDRYYAFENPVDIIEFDETGRKFQIAHLEPLTSLDLVFDDDKKMRDRYQIKNLRKLDNFEIKTMYEKWVIPTCWR